jgi:hypothetical protein
LLSHGDAATNPKQRAFAKDGFQDEGPDVGEYHGVKEEIEDDRLVSLYSMDDERVE